VAVAFEIGDIGLGRHGMNRQAGFYGEGNIHHAVFEPSALNLVGSEGIVDSSKCRSDQRSSGLNVNRPERPRRISYAEDGKEGA